MEGKNQKDDKVKWERNFPRCPQCGSGETVMRESWRAVKGEIPHGVYLALRSAAVPLTLTPATTLSLPFVPVLMASYDICTECGLERCVRVEVKTIDSRTIAAAVGLLPQPGPQKRN
ncbi:MAG: hypothetical protein Q8O55_01360 [Dehalococcoidales bacterium]|nr:hypothetical protein [Dehalococcoidales bacterium]